jgi:hypothetical protein
MNREYSLSDFDFIPQVEVATTGEEKSPKPEGWRDEILEGVSEGERNISLTQLAGSYVSKRLSRNEIFAILKEANSQFKPPLPIKEVETILDSIIKTDQRNHPEAIAKEKPAPSWPAPLAKEAFHGLAGEYIRSVELHTEADPVGLLTQFLSMFGNVVGSGPYYQVEADRHSLKIYPVLVGETSKGRKGISSGRIKRVFGAVDPDWARNRIMSGLSTGEGLIWQVRDEIRKTEAIREKGKPAGSYEEVVIDSGIRDKRLFVIEPEFASTLRVIGREGNTLSPTIRQAWDDGNLGILTKNSPARSTGAHISIVGHITRDELRRYLDRSEMANGFANRYVWICVKRSRILPEGGRLQDTDLISIISRLKEAVEFGKTVGEIKKDDRAMDLWAATYPELSEGKPGLLGAVISRGEAQVIRMACIYALLDRSNLIREEHLLAALAIWDYSEASARYIFGGTIGNPLADRIIIALRSSARGLTRTEINNLFARNVKAERIDLALLSLRKSNRASMATENTDGRPVERWHDLGD